MNTEKKSSKKGLVIAALVLAAIAAVAGAFFAYKNHQETLREYRDIADTLIYREYVPLDWRGEMLRGEGWRGAAYLEAKDQPTFRKILVEQFQLMLDEGKAEGAGIGGFTPWVGEVVALLDEQGIQDETIRAAYQTFMAGKRQELTTDAKSYTVQAFFEGLQAVSASSFYGDGIMSEGEAADFLRGRVEASLDKKDFEGLSKNLDMLAETGLLELCYPQPEELVDTLLAHCEVYAAAKGRGGYYDDMEDASSSHSSGLDPAGMGSSIGTRSSSSTDKYYGDFHYNSYSSTTQYDGLVDQKSKDKYNSSSSGQSVKFRDMDIDGWAGSFRWAADKGAQFALCGRYHDADDKGSGLRCVALLSGGQLYIPGKSGNKGMECYTASGSFQDQLREVQTAYQENYSILAWYDNATSKLAQGDLDGAAELFQLYPAYQEAQDGLMQIAMTYLEAEDYQKGIDALGMTDAYKGLKDKTVADVVKMLAKFDPEYSHRTDFAPSFCRLLASVLTPLTGEEIRTQLVGSWTSLPNERWRIDADGTWIELSGTSNRFTATWTTEGSTIVRFADSTGKRAELVAYNILDAYYYVTYTDGKPAYLLQKKG